MAFSAQLHHKSTSDKHKSTVPLSTWLLFHLPNNPREEKCMWHVHNLLFLIPNQDSRKRGTLSELEDLHWCFAVLQDLCLSEER